MHNGIPPHGLQLCLLRTRCRISFSAARQSGDEMKSVKIKEFCVKVIQLSCEGTHPSSKPSTIFNLNFSDDIILRALNSDPNPTE